MNARLVRPRLLVALFGLATLACEAQGDSTDHDSTGPTATTTAGQAEVDTGPPPMTTAEPPKADLGIDPPAECTFACDVRSECLGESHDDCVLACDAAHGEHATTSDACVGAYETLLGCIASLSCDEVAQYQTAAGDYPCADQEIAVDSACAGDMPPPAVCEPLCATTSGCTGDDPAACLTLCTEAIANAQTVGTACADAQTAVFECVAELSCADYDAWASGTDSPCLPADDTAAAECTPS